MDNTTVRNDQGGNDTTAQNFMRIMALLKAKMWKVVAVTVAVLLLTGIYIFSLPRTWKSEVILLPETTTEGISGNLSSLASLAGVKMGNSSEDAIYPEFYPKVLGSTVFLTDLLKEQIKPARIGKRISVFDYFATSQKSPWWGGLMGKKKKTVDPRVNPLCITKDQQTVVTRLKDSFFCAVDKKTDMITIRVTAQDADAAAQIADLICKRLKEYITNYRTNKARTDLEYTKKITAEAKAQYVQAQQKYAAYCDANEDITLASFTQVRDRLENEMQMAYNMYQQSMQQMQLAQAKLQERTPVYVTIQPATIPSKPSGPKRMITMVLFFILSLFGCLAGITLKDIYHRKFQHADTAIPTKSEA